MIIHARNIAMVGHFWLVSTLTSFSGKVSVRIKSLISHVMSLSCLFVMLNLSHFSQMTSRCYFIIYIILSSYLVNLWVLFLIYLQLSPEVGSNIFHFLLRYVDVCVGLSLLVSQTCLVYGARGSRIQHVLAFFILSSLVILSYWTYWACLYYSRAETEASKEASDNLIIYKYITQLLLIANIYTSMHTL